MRPRAAFLALVLVASAAIPGCSQREHSNIFDPANPVTRGQPIDFAAVAGDGVVRLSWRQVEAEGLVGYELLRRVAGQPGFSSLGVLPFLQGQYTDVGLANGVDHHYELYYVLSSGRAGLPAVDIATPGPLRVWLADLGGRLLRVAPDGRRIASTEDHFENPSHVAANPTSGLVWISDGTRGEVVLHSPGFGTVSAFAGMGHPTAIALDPVRRIAWVCDDQQGVVHHLSEISGRVSPQIGPVDDPIGCAIDPFDGSVWVCENRGNRVRRFSPTGTVLADRALTRPTRVAVDSVTHDAWVTSLDQRAVIRLGLGGTPIDTVALAGPVGVAVDARRGRIWIADAGGDAVVVLDRDGTTVFRIGGLLRVTEIAVDLRTGDAWATRPDAGELIRIAADGSRVSRLGGLGRPYGVSAANAP